MDHSHHEHHSMTHDEHHSAVKNLALHVDHAQHGHSHHVEDFRRRFWICLVLTIPIVLLSHTVVELLHLPYSVDFTAAEWIVLLLSTVVFFFGGWPFLHGLWSELKAGRPGMMTLIGLATSVAYVFSVAVTFGFRGMPLFWELATLIDIMLLGHWIEMKSVLGASQALEALVKLLPQTPTALLPMAQPRKYPLISCSRATASWSNRGRRSRRMGLWKKDSPV